MALLTNFHSIRPPFESTQEDTLEWLVAAHTMAERHGADLHPEFEGRLRETLWHVGCKPEAIAKRGHVLQDFHHCKWDEMQVYKLKQTPIGSDLGKRMVYFQQHADRVLEEFYEGDSSAPDDLIHVSCTGYLAPSAAQKLVSRKQWGQQTTVTHAYHMGCYGSLPAIRMARGFLHETSHSVDIVHTEICTIHSNPSLHRLDQLVSQSLFADGFIKYSVKKNVSDAHLKIHAIREEIISDSLEAMTWDVVEWGYAMSLSKEVVVYIARALRKYLERLSTSSLWTAEQLIRNAFFAIHPGGPKILSHVQKILGLLAPQLAHSTAILKAHGNMSSATLPHIWKALLEDPAVPSGPIVSLAFGPGLTLSGCILEKLCG